MDGKARSRALLFSYNEKVKTMKTLINITMVALTLLALLACKPPTKQEPAPPAPATATTRVPNTTPAVATAEPKSMADEVAEQPTLKMAIEYVKPLLEDTEDQHSKGTLLLTLWAKDHMDVLALNTIPTTTYEQATKDSEGERGKRLCGAGRIVQISKSTLKAWEGKPVWEGIVLLNSRKILKYVVVGDTGSLVEDSPVNICGIITGKYQYANSGGGTSHALAIVGVFTGTR